MIKVLRSGFLTFYKNKFKCSVGKNGFTRNKAEGDLKTPIGNFKIIKCFYRSDRVKDIQSKLKFIDITKKMGWCDDVSSKFYNKQVDTSLVRRHEKLFRRDSLYDIVLVLNYNTEPIKKFKGSAIFFHIATKNFSPTQGCIGLEKNKLLKLVKYIDDRTQIKII